MLAKRWGTEHESVVPYKAFRTADGYLTLGTGNDAQFRSFCERIGMPELAADDRFADNARRVDNRKQLYGIIDPVLASKTNAHWTRVFDGSPFPVGPVNDMAQVILFCRRVSAVFGGRAAILSQVVAAHGRRACISGHGDRTTDFRRIFENLLTHTFRTGVYVLKTYIFLFFQISKSRSTSPSVFICFLRKLHMLFICVINRVYLLFNSFSCLGFPLRL